MQIFHPIEATPDEAAAALAVVARVLIDEAAATVLPAAHSAWRAAAALEAQEITAAPGTPAPTWGTADRARRLGRWSGGIVGG